MRTYFFFTASLCFVMILSAHSQNKPQMIIKTLNHTINSCKNKCAIWAEDTLLRSDEKFLQYRSYQYIFNTYLFDSLINHRYYTVIYSKAKDSLHFSQQKNNFDINKTAIYIYEAPNTTIAKAIDSLFYAIKEWYIEVGLNKDINSKNGSFDELMINKSVDHRHFTVGRYIIYITNPKKINCAEFDTKLRESFQ